MKIGYARISTRKQNLTMQVIALIKQLRPGDVLMVWKLDRLGRSLKHLIDFVQTFSEGNIGLCSLNDPIDTTIPGGRLVFNIFASLAEFERDIIWQRTQAGLQAARSRGKLGGRPRWLIKYGRSHCLCSGNFIS